MSIPAVKTSEKPIYFTDDKQDASAQVLSGLASHILQRYAEARRYREKFLEPEMLACHLQARGEYNSDTLAKITAVGGCELFFPMTGPKIGAFKALSNRQLSERENTTWKLERSPISDLPEEAMRRVVRGATEALLTRMTADGQWTPEEIQEASDRLYDLEEEKLAKIADKRVKRLQTKLQDMLVEGGFYQAIREATGDQGTYPYCVVHGPYLKTVKRQKWHKGKAMMVMDQVWSWNRVSPWNFYFGPQTEKPWDSYTIEKSRPDRKLLQAMRGRPGYSTEAIDEALRPLAAAAVELSPFEQARARSEGGADSESDFAKAPEGLLYHGEAYGQDLLDWGLDEKTIPEPDHWYHIFAEMVGTHIVHAGLDSGAVGEKPYFGTVFQNTGEGPTGQSIPMLIRSSQTGYNFFKRAALNNGAWSSVPDVKVDVDSIEGDAPKQPYPGMYTKFHQSRLAGTGKVVTYDQQENHVESYLAAAKTFKAEGDNDVSIPQFLYGGETRVGGAGDTLGGLQLLTDQALAAIEEATRNVEVDIIVPSLSMAVRILYAETDDDSLRGDCVVIPCGVMQQTLRQERARRQMEFMRAVGADAVIGPLVTAESRMAVYRKVATELELPAAEIFPEQSGVELAGQAGVGGLGAGPVAGSSGAMQSSPAAAGGIATQ